MRRLVPFFFVAVLSFGVGFLFANAGPPQNTFRLSIDAPTGETTIKCEGCEFLTWTSDGRAGENQPTLSITCDRGPCWKVVGALALAPKPRLMAQTGSPLVAR